MDMKKQVCFYKQNYNAVFKNCFILSVVIFASKLIICSSFNNFNVGYPSILNLSIRASTSPVGFVQLISR